MKKKLFFVLAALALAVSCQDNGLDDGQVPQNQIELTATIASPAASRVTYDVNNTAGYEAVTPYWTKGDGLFGFDDSGNAFNLQVEEIDEGGRAKMTVTDGTLAGPTLYVFYAPGMDKDDLSDADGNGLRTLEVDLSSQDGTLSDASPVLMSAKASVLNGGALLVFENNTAIVGVKRFKMPEAATVTGVTLHGVVTSGTFSVDGDGDIVLTPGSVSAVAATAKDDEWETGEGNICSTQVSFAVLPTDDALLTLNAVTATKEYANVAVISSVKIVAGYYYHMAKEFNLPVAQIGSVKYGSIDVAMTIANASDEDVTVTLLDDCTAAAQLALGDDTGSGTVTLDLNGCKLTTITSDYGILVDNRTLTIEDSGSGGEIESESTTKYLLYTSHAANVTVSSGKLTSAYRAIMVQTNATVDIKGTAAISSSVVGVYSYGTLNVSGSASIEANEEGIFVTSGTTTISENATVTAPEDGKYGCYVYSASNSPKLVVEGGTIKSLASSYLNNAIRVATNGTAEISGGTIYGVATPIYIINSGSVSIEGDASISSTNGSYALINSNTADQSTLTIEGGRFTAPGINPVSGNGYRYVTGGLFNRPVNNLATRDTLNTLYYNTLNTDAETKGDYPYCLVSSELEGVSLAATATRGTTVYDHASIESALNHVTVDASATNNELVIQLLEDAETSSTLTMTGASKNASLDLNNCTWTSTASPALTSNVLSFTLYDSSSDGAGELSTTGNVALSVTAGTTTVNSGSLVGAVNAATVAADATLNVNNGYLYGAEDGDDVSADKNASVTLAAGWYRNEPSSDYLVSGTVAQSGSETHNNRTYGWTIGVETAVVEVNEVGYASLGAAIAAANAFDGEAEADSVVTIKLLGNIGYDDHISLTNANDKPIVLDLNNYTLSTDSANFITTTGSLTITDSSVGGDGKILSNEKNVLYLNSSSAHIIVEKCLIKSTFEATNTGGSYTSTNSIVYVNNGATLSVENNARIWATDAHVCYAGATGTVTINVENAELTSCNYCIYVGGAADVNITGEETSFYSTGEWLLMYCASKDANIAISGGYFYRNNTGSTPFSSANIGQYSFTGGHFSAVPTGATAASGYRFDEDEDSHTHTTTTPPTELSYGYGVLYGLPDVADVNGTKYKDYATAISDALAYTGADDTVRITLLRNVSYNDTTNFVNASSKPIVLNLNDKTLSTTKIEFIKCRAGSLSVRGGTITSSAINVVNKVGSGKINIENCTISSSATYAYATGYYYNEGVIRMNNSSSTINIKDSKIYTTGRLAAVVNRSGTLNIDDSEITSGTESTGSIAVCTYQGTTTINSGCFYSSTDSSTRPPVYLAYSTGKLYVKGGYYYSANSSYKTVRSTNADNTAKIEVTGGYFNVSNNSGTMIPKIPTGYAETSTSVTYAHPIKGTLNFSYVVGPTEGAAAATASLSEAVASYGAPVSGGVKFLRK